MEMSPLPVALMPINSVEAELFTMTVPGEPNVEPVFVVVVAPFPADAAMRPQPNSTPAANRSVKK